MWPMRWLAPSTRSAISAALSGGGWRLSTVAAATMDCSGVRRSWLSTAMNISLMRNASVRARSSCASACLRRCSSKNTPALLVSMCGSMGLYRKSTAPLSYPRNCQFCSREPAVMKMSGMCRVRSLPRISSASSKPFISGICTSSNARATSSWASSSSRASGPDWALRMSSPSRCSSASRAMRFSSTSSTSRHLVRSVWGMGGRECGVLKEGRMCPDQSNWRWCRSASSVAMPSGGRMWSTANPAMAACGMVGMLALAGSCTMVRPPAA